MKCRFSLVLSILFLMACTGSPSIDALLKNNDLMSEIKKAAQRENSSAGIIPIAIEVGSLVGKNLISNASADKIKALTNCNNLSGVKLIFTQGEITNLNVDAAKCSENEQNDE